MTSSPLELAHDIAAAAGSAGGHALVVGGFVRDRLLGLTSKDLDLEVFGLSPAALVALLARFGRVEPVGQSFPVFKIGTVDVALPRRESKTGRGHKGFTVAGDPDMSFEEAVRRRDFTINAIGWNPLVDEYVDPCGGQSDLADRVLRAVQFAARFDLTLEPVSADICRAIPLDDLPAERVWGEIEKLLLLASRPSSGLALALDLGVIARLFPELLALVGCAQEPEWHPEGDVWVHTLMVVDEARGAIDDLDRARQAIVMLGALCHDLGKPPTTRVIDGRIRSLGHEEAGVEPASALLDRLNVNSMDGLDVRAQVLAIVAHHLKPGAWHKAPTVGDGAFRRLAAKVEMELLARVARADCRGRGGGFDCSAMDWFLERARRLGVEREAPRPLVLGRHLLALGVAPGPRMGEILREIYELQLDGQVTTEADGIAAAAAIIRPPL